MLRPMSARSIRFSSISPHNSMSRHKKENGAGSNPRRISTLKRIVKVCSDLDRLPSRRGRFLLRERAVRRILIRRLVDLDRALKVGAVFDHDARRGEVAVDRAVLLDLDAIFRAKIALHRPVDNHFTGDDIGGDLGGRADGELPLVELDQSFDRTVDQEVLAAGDLALHMQARSEPRAGAVVGCTQWTQRICRHCGFFLPRRRSRLRRLIYWIHCNWPRLRLRRSLRLLLRRIRLLISPHSKLPQGLAPKPYISADALQTVAPALARG